MCVYVCVMAVMVMHVLYGEDQNIKHHLQTFHPNSFILAIADFYHLE